MDKGIWKEILYYSEEMPELKNEPELKTTIGLKVWSSYHTVSAVLTGSSELGNGA